MTSSNGGTAAIATKQRQVHELPAVRTVADMLGIGAEDVVGVLRKVCQWGAEFTTDDIIGCLVTCSMYRLNPITGEIFLMKSKKSGKLLHYVSVDGFSKILHNSKRFDGVSFSRELSGDGHPISCTCSLRLKGVEHPIEVTEYLVECEMDTDPWKNSPMRMLRHKAFRQAVRLALGVSVPDEDDARAVDSVRVEPRHPAEDRVRGVEGLRSRITPLAATVATVSQAVVDVSEIEDEIQSAEPDHESPMPAPVNQAQPRTPEEQKRAQVGRFWALLTRLRPDLKGTDQGMESLKESILQTEFKTGSLMSLPIEKIRWLNDQLDGPKGPAMVNAREV